MEGSFPFLSPSLHNIVKLLVLDKEAVVTEFRLHQFETRAGDKLGQFLQTSRREKDI